MAIAPLINGRRYSFASIEIAAKIGATSQQLFIDCDDISYSEELEIAFKRGTGVNPIGWTQGVYTAGECQLHLGKSSFQQMVQTTGPGWLGINLVLLISYFDVGEILTVDTIIGRTTGVEEGHTYGPEALHSVLKILPFTILRNGVPPTFNQLNRVA